MRLAINLLLILGIIAGVWLLNMSIQEPIAFSNERTKRERAVIDKLKQIRTTQELYRQIVGKYAKDFDTLSHVMNNGFFNIIKETGDKDNPENTEEISIDTIQIRAKDSLNVLGINVDSLRFVPFSNGAIFDMIVDTVTYQGTLIDVIECGAKRKVFMGRYADARFARYDDKYDPEAPIKFGNLGAPNISGNWE